MYELGGLVGLIILICTIWAIVKIITSSAKIEEKILWIVIIVLIPPIGVILWFLLWPYAKR